MSSPKAAQRDRRKPVRRVAERNQYRITGPGRVRRSPGRQRRDVRPRCGELRHLARYWQRAVADVIDTAGVGVDSR